MTTQLDSLKQLCIDYPLECVPLQMYADELMERGQDDLSLLVASLIGATWKRAEKSKLSFMWLKPRDKKCFPTFCLYRFRNGNVYHLGRKVDSNTKNPDQGLSKYWYRRVSVSDYGIKVEEVTNKSWGCLINHLPDLLVPLKRKDFEEFDKKFPMGMTPPDFFLSYLDSDDE